MAQEGTGVEGGVGEDPSSMWIDELEEEIAGRGATMTGPGLVKKASRLPWHSKTILEKF